MLKNNRIICMILTISIIMTVCSAFGTVYAENPYGYDLFGLLASQTMNSEIESIIYGGLIDGYGTNSEFYGVKSELADEQARLKYANDVKTYLQLDFTAEDISYAILDFYAFSNSKPEVTDIMIKYLLSGNATVDEGMTINTLPYIKAYIEEGYYSSVFVISVLKNLGEIGKTVYGDEFAMMSSYAGILYIENDTRALMTDNFCEAIIGSNCSEFLNIMVEDFAANVSSSEINGITDYFNTDKMYISQRETDIEDRFNALFESYGKSFANAEEIVKTALNKIGSDTSEEKINKIIKETVNEAATIVLDADYAYTFCEISNDVYEYAFLNAKKVCDLFEEEGYSFDLSEIEITAYFEKDTDEGVFQIMSPSGMFTLAENYGMTRMNVKTKSMTVSFLLSDIAVIVPDGAVVVMFVLQNLSVAPDSLYMTPSKRPQYAFSVAADAEDLETEWDSGAVKFTVDLSETPVSSSYFLREFSNDKSIAEPEIWEYDNGKRTLNFDVRPLKYYSFVTAEEEEKIKNGEKIIEPIKNEVEKIPENTDDDKENNNNTDTEEPWDDIGYNDSSNSGGSSGGSASEDKKPEENESEDKKEENSEEKPSKSMFDDLGVDHWAYKPIETLVMYGIVNGTGDGCFEPETQVTREQFVKMLLGAMGISVDTKISDTEGLFSDMQEDEWYVPYVLTAKEKGIVNGISEAEFGIGEPISRQDMATMAMRASVKQGVMLTRINKNEKIVFSDSADIASYAAESITVMQTAGIINGYEDNTFKPTAFATRAEASKIIYSLLSIVEGWKD